jgi:hypothetical protein
MVSDPGLGYAGEMPTVEVVRTARRGLCRRDRAVRTSATLRVTFPDTPELVGIWHDSPGTSERSPGRMQSRFAEVLEGERGANSTLGTVDAAGAFQVYAEGAAWTILLCRSVPAADLRAMVGTSELEWDAVSGTSKREGVATAGPRVSRLHHARAGGTLECGCAEGQRRSLGHSCP